MAARLPSLFAVAALLLCACGPQIGNLEKGETGRVVRAYNGDTLELDSGLRVFLAEIDAPRGEDDYASQANGELEALALHRDVLLAYGGARRWVGQPREGQVEPPQAAIAHVFVKSEGGRWFWLQHALIARGAAFVRPRRDNHARTDELLALEEQARAAELGLWKRRAWRVLDVRAATRAAHEANADCRSGAAPYRVIEGHVARVDVSDTRASLILEGPARGPPFSIVLFDENFTAWDGAAPTEFSDADIRARGPLGLFQDAPQLCLEHKDQIQITVNE